MPDLEPLFFAYLESVDVAYLAFCREPFQTSEEHDAAYAAKDRRTGLLCRLRQRVEALGYSGVAEWYTRND